MIPDELKFRISSRTARLLGRENISNSTVAVLELVKNSYDADATTVEVSFRQASTLEGEIVISDDGTGMELEDVREKWMVIGTDNKRLEPFSPGRKRVRVGEKGVGRLALDRLAANVTLDTHTAGSDTGLRLTIDWDKYEGGQGNLEDIGHPLEIIKSTPREHGTTLRLSRLRDKWTERNIEQLHRDLALLLPPVEDGLPDFSINFYSDENPDLATAITGVLPELAEFTLQSRLDKSGHIENTVIHRTGQTYQDTRNWQDIFNSSEVEDNPRCGPVEMNFHFYLRESRSVTGSGVSFNSFIRFLDEFRGIRIYRDHMRVKPYGQPSAQEDWLGLNARRAASPAGVRRPVGQYRVAGNQVMGSIFISRDENPHLVDQTNREGLIENNSFSDLKRFALYGIQFLERTRQEYEQSTEGPSPNRDFDKVVQQKEVAIVEQVTSTLAKIPDPAHIDIAEEIIRAGGLGLEGIIQAHDSELSDLLDENRLLAGLATLGIALVAFGHETPRLVNAMWGRTSLLRGASQYLPEDRRNKFDEDLEFLRNNITRVQGWAEFALKHINRDKRTRRMLDINEVCQTSLESFSSLLEERSISVDEIWSAKSPKLLGFAMDFESIMLNLITNAVEAMRKTPLSLRQISVATDLSDANEEIVLRFSDSGVGIDERDVSRIFDPMFSTRLDANGNPSGTGLGLTIVKTNIERYKGRVEVVGKGPIGGATFVISLPHKQTR